MTISVGTAIRALEPGGPSGDAGAAMPWEKGTIVTLVDGLGHGPRAAEAAQVYIDAVRAHANASLVELFSKAHQALTRTRGVVASLARFDHARGEVEIVGLGNITTFVARGSRTEGVVVPAGVLGSAYRTVRSQTLPFQLGDTLLMHTDGVRTRFDYGALRALDAQQIADSVLRVAGKGSDDAGCIVARSVAGGSQSIAAPPSVVAPPIPEQPIPADARRIPIAIASDPATCALEARNYAAKVGLSQRAQWEVSITASELATNVLKFAGKGSMTLSFEVDSLVIEVVDQGRGIEEVDAAVVDGWSEGSKLSPDRPRRQGQGLGVGLGTIHRMMDKVRVESEPGRGTRIVAHKKR